MEDYEATQSLVGNHVEICKICGGEMEVKLSGPQAKNPNRMFFRCPEAKSREHPCNKSFAWVLTDKNGLIIGASKGDNKKDHSARAGGFIKTSDPKPAPPRSTNVPRIIHNKGNEAFEIRFEELERKLEAQHNTLMDIGNLIEKIQNELNSGYKDSVDLVANTYLNSKEKTMNNSKKRKIEYRDDDMQVTQED